MDCERLKTLRQKKGLTQAQISKIFGFSNQRYNYYETGKREPDHDSIIRFAEYFNTSSDYLLGIVDNPTPPGQAPKMPTLEEMILNDAELSEESKQDMLKQLELLKIRDSFRAGE